MNIRPELLAEAWHLAAERHKTSYLLHLGWVWTEMAVALEHEPDPDGELSLLCAILHDTMEDTNTSWEELAQRFGERVANGVDALSKRDDHPDPMGDSLARIRQQPKAVWKVKLADRVTNLAPPPKRWTREKCARYLAEAQRIAEALGEASPALLSRLQRRMERYPEYWPEASAE